MLRVQDIVMYIQFTAVEANPLGIQFFDKDVVNPLWISYPSFPSFSLIMCHVYRDLFHTGHFCTIHDCVVFEMQTFFQIQLHTVREWRSWPGIYWFECLFSHNYLDSIHMDELHAIPKRQIPSGTSLLLHCSSFSSWYRYIVWPCTSQLT